MCLYCNRAEGALFPHPSLLDWAPGLTADVSALWDEGWGQRDGHEERRHHRLLAGLLEGLSPGVRTRQGGRAGGRGTGGRRWGLWEAGVTVKTALECAMTRDGVAQTECGGKSERRLVLCSPRGVADSLILLDWSASIRLFAARVGLSYRCRLPPPPASPIRLLPCGCHTVSSVRKAI